jgi:hypothetical protein
MHSSATHTEQAPDQETPPVPSRKVEVDAPSTPESSSDSKVMDRFSPDPYRETDRYRLVNPAMFPQPKSEN